MNERLVHYISPFGSPAWMLRDQASKNLKADDLLWLELQEAGALSEAQQLIGPPRIEFIR